jgi:hypothetical protein
VIYRLLSSWLLTLLAGGIVFNNLAVLLGPLEPYDAAWWKVILAIAISLAFCLRVFTEMGKP